MSASHAEPRKVSLKVCARCSSPVLAGSGYCRECGGRLTGKEAHYMPRSGSSQPDLQSLLIWWAIWTVSIWVFSGFSLGITSPLLMTVVALIYLMRLWRAWFKD